MRKRTLLALIVSLAIFGSLYALAASLGGITSDSVGADSAVVASCDTNGVTAAYVSGWDATDERYEITSVTVGGVADTCDGRTMSVTLTDTSGAQIGSGTLSIPTSVATSFAVTMSSAASAELTEGVNILIT
jgi:hypothetical protein